LEREILGKNSPKGAEPRKKLVGVFSTMEMKKVGTGTTMRKTKAKQYWLVKELEEGRVEVQPVTEKLIPVGKKRTVAMEDLLERFEPEPEFIVGLSFEQKGGETGRAIGEFMGAGLGAEAGIEDFDVSGSPESMEKNARAGFGLGLTYLKRGNLQKAQELFERLAALEADFVPGHKRMFNDFGVSLRKENLYDTALKHYMRALKLSGGKDDNLLHNIARAYFEKNDIKNAVKYLESSLRLNPRHKESKQFLNYIKKNRKDAVTPIRMDF